MKRIESDAGAAHAHVHEQPRARRDMTSERSILVVYYSLTGRTQRVAEDLAARLGADLERIEDVKSRRGFLGYLRAALDSLREKPARITDIRQFPNRHVLTVIGTPVWAGKMTPAIRAYLRMIRGRVNDVALFTTSGSTEVKELMFPMEALVGREAVAIAGFDQKDFADAGLYEQKLAAFASAIRRAAEIASINETGAEMQRA
jgi:hypothetical protein